MGFFTLILFSATSVVAETTVPPPTRIRSVQIGAFTSVEESEELKSKVTELGYEPVWEIEKDGYHKILIGKLSRLTDATIIKTYLIENGFPGAFEVAFPNVDNTNFESDYSTPAPHLLFPDLKGNGFTYKSSHNSELKLTLEQEILEEQVLIERDFSKITELRQLQEKSLVNDPLKGWATLIIAKAIVLRDKSAVKAIPLFEQIAHGKLPSTENTALEARWCLADSWHYYDKQDPLKAYIAYNEILEKYGNENEPAKARAMIEISACLLELAQRQKSYFNEVRRSVKLFQQAIPESYDRAHAVADLIYCESYLFEGDKPQSLKEFEGFEHRHPNRPREVAMSFHMRGWLLAESNRWEEAVPYFEKVLETDLPVNESFYWQGERWNLKRLSAKWLMQYSGQNKDLDRQKIYAEYVDGEEYNKGFDKDALFFDSAFPHKFYEEKISQ